MRGAAGDLVGWRGMADLGNLYLLKIKCLTDGPSSLGRLGWLRIKIMVRELGWDRKILGGV